MKTRLLSTLALFATAAGCSFAPSVEDVQNATASAATAICDNAGAGAEAVANMPTVGALGAGMTSMFKAAPDVAQQFLLPKPEVLQGLMVNDELVQQLMPRRDGVVAKASPTVQQGTAESMHAVGQSLARLLRERIFTEENVEERTFDAIIFRVTGKDVCVYEDATGKFQPISDPACASSFDRFEVRIKAQQPDALELTLLMGPDRYAPLVLDFTEDSFAVTADFVDLKKTYLYVAQVLGMNVVMPEVMEGKVRVMATRYGDSDYGVDFSVLQEVKLEQTAGTTKTFLHVAAKSPISTARYDGIQKRLTSNLDLGAVELGMPSAYAYGAGMGGPDTQFTWHLGGASYSFDTREGDTEMLVTNVGIGDEQSYWALNGTKLDAFDLNAASGRRFDMRVVTQAGADPLFKFSPGFDLAEHLNLEPMASYGVSVPAWAYTENLSVVLGGADPTLQAIPYNYDTNTPGALKVASGTLTLTADEPGIAQVVVEAGQCLLRDPASTSQHPFGAYYAGTCP